MGAKRKRWLLLVLAGLLGLWSCGIKGAPRPPRVERAADAGVENTEATHGR